MNRSSGNKVLDCPRNLKHLSRIVKNRVHYTQADLDAYLRDRHVLPDGQSDETAK